MNLRRGQVVQLHCGAGPYFVKRSRVRRTCSVCTRDIAPGELYASPERGGVDACSECVEPRP